MSLRLKIGDVSLKIGNVSILSHIDFEIHKGEVLALLGDNGAGKSSLIKILSGYYKATSGLFQWEGKRMDLQDHDPSRARDLGIQTVYQHLGLVDSMSIARNFFLGQEPEKTYFGFFNVLDKKFMQKHVSKILKEMKISRNLDPDTLISKLSGGERQAVAISRARYFGAKLLILDEPTSALSLKQTEEVLDLIRRASEEGLSVIFITHSLHHIRDLVDRVYIMKQGSICANLKAPVSEEKCASFIR